MDYVFLILTVKYFFELSFGYGKLLRVDCYGEFLSELAFIGLESGVFLDF